MSIKKVHLRNYPSVTLTSGAYAITYVIAYVITYGAAYVATYAMYETKLEVDKEVGVGDLSEPCAVTYLIAYPYAWTVNFEICIDSELTTPSMVHLRSD